MELKLVSDFNKILVRYFKFLECQFYLKSSMKTTHPLALDDKPNL
jgi:hypothetical protein